MRFRRLFALLMVFAIMAAACGGSSSDSTDTAGGDESSGEQAQDDAATPTTVKEVESIEKEDEAAAGEVVTGEPALADRGPDPSGTLDYAWHTAFSPKWLDPSLNTSSVSQFATQYILHDALVKSMPGKPFWPSLAESYTIAEDFTSATFTLREGLTFHDGSDLTTEDVEFTYNNYSGSGAGTLQDMTESIDLVDDLTITFNFKRPFLDFLLLYGSTATGAGWILPSDYYQEVGAEGFLGAPIGAGPFKFVENNDNAKVVYEANTDWWFKNPGVETINFNAITDSATRLAAISTGELDLANVLSGDLLDAANADPNVTVVPTTAAPFWFEFIGFEDEDSPFNDIRVREAVSLALDRDAINQDETQGGGESTGHWIPRQQQDSISPAKIDQDLERARELMAEAGFADGFDIPAVTPLPNYFTLGERVIQALGEIGIRGTLNQMDRGEFLGQVNAGKDGNFEKNSIVLNISGAGGDAAVRVRNFATCEGAASRICNEFIDEKFAEYEASIDADERLGLITEIQEYIIDEHIFPYVYSLGLNMAQGPDVVQAGNEVWAQIPQYVYPGPWENITVQ